MNENEIAVFSAKLSAFRAGLSGDEQGLLDRIVTQKEGDSDVQAHWGFRAIQFELEDGSYQGWGFRAAKVSDDNDVQAHGF